MGSPLLRGAFLLQTDRIESETGADEAEQRGLQQPRRRDKNSGIITVCHAVSAACFFCFFL